MEILMDNEYVAVHDVVRFEVSPGIDTLKNMGI